MIANLLTFPLLFISSAFVPLEVLPNWIQTVALVNPITYGVDAIRALMLGKNVLSVFDMTVFGGIWSTLVPAVAVLVGFLLVFGSVAVYLLNNAAKAEVH